MDGDGMLIEIVSPRGKVLRIPNFQFQQHPQYNTQLMEARCEAIREWMALERLVTDE